MKHYLSIILFLISLLPIHAWQPNDPLFPYQEKYEYCYSIKEGTTNCFRSIYPGQWYLINQAPKKVYSDVNAGININVKPLWERDVTGKGVVIGIADTFIQGDHPDLASNYREDLSKFFANKTIDEIKNSVTDGLATSDELNHGTAVAGLAAARGGNGIGITGVAPHAEVAGLSMLEFDKIHDDLIWHLSGMNKTTGKYINEPSIHIKNHSYGYSLIPPNSTEIDTALAVTSQNGVIHVFAGGNNRDRISNFHNSNLDGGANSPYVIAVGSTSISGIYSYYSSSGSNLFVTAPGSDADRYIFSSRHSSKQHLSETFGIATTVLTWDHAGFNNGIPETIDSQGPYQIIRHDCKDTDYTFYFGGTSASAPILTGALALAKELNPLMDTRMAKHALVKSCRFIHPSDDDPRGGWVQNAAGNYFNNNYGFGLIDATALADSIKNTAYVTANKELTAHHLQYYNDGSKLIQPFQFSATNNLSVEQVFFGIDFSDQSYERLLFNLQVDLISPSGTRSKILTPSPNCYSYSENLFENYYYDNNCLAFYKNHLMTSNAFWGEDPNGTWTLILQDPCNGLDGFYFKGFQAKIFVGNHVSQQENTQVLSENTDANALTLLKHDNNWFIIEKGKKLRLKNGILLKKGKLTVNGIVKETNFKGNRIDLEGGELSGEGILYARRGFYNTKGNLTPQGLTIIGNYKQTGDGKLIIQLNNNSRPYLQITGNAKLKGTLDIRTTDGFEFIAGSQIPILQADSITHSVSTLFNGEPELDIGALTTYFKTNNILIAGILCDQHHCINPYTLDPKKDSDFLSMIEPIKRRLNSNQGHIYFNFKEQATPLPLTLKFENSPIPLVKEKNFPLMDSAEFIELGTADEKTILTLSLNGRPIYAFHPTTDLHHSPIRIESHIIEIKTEFIKNTHTYNVYITSRAKDPSVDTNHFSYNLNSLQELLPNKPEEVRVKMHEGCSYYVKDTDDYITFHLNKTVLTSHIKTESICVTDPDQMLCSSPYSTCLGLANSQSELIIQSKKIGLIGHFKLYDLQKHVLEYKHQDTQFNFSVEVDFYDTTAHIDVYGLRYR